MSPTNRPSPFELFTRDEECRELLWRIRRGCGNTDLASRPDDLDRALAVVAYPCESLQEVWEASRDVRHRLRLLQYVSLRIIDENEYSRALRLFACRLVSIARPECSSLVEVPERHARGQATDEELRAHYDDVRLRVRCGAALGCMKGAITMEQHLAGVVSLPCEAARPSAVAAAEGVAANLVRNAPRVWSLLNAALDPAAGQAAPPPGDAAAQEVAAMLTIFLCRCIGNPLHRLTQLHAVEPPSTPQVAPPEAAV